MPQTFLDNAVLIKLLAHEAGFDLIGIARPQVSPWADAYRQWIAAGKHGDMHYLARTAEDRVDLLRKLPWAKSVICVALAYWPGSADETTPDDAGKIARYARGRDYHTVMEKKLRGLERAIREKIPGPITMRTWVDTGPIMEREYAQWAGLGWVGKSTLLIHPRHGTYFLLGELVTSLDLPEDSPITDHCGTCTRCIDACPTAAIEPYSVDGVKCLSYQTLENRGDIPAELRPGMQRGKTLVGCDICQEVCPFNREPLVATEPDLLPQGLTATGNVSLPVIQGWDEQAWDVATRGKAHRRAKLFMWQRNARILAGGVNIQGPMRTSAPGPD